MIISLFDALEIQDYLFNSNRLQDNIGASSLVQDALSDWLVEALAETGLPQEHLVLCGGGNAMFFFDSMDDARKMAGIYSRILHERAPGLQVVCYHYKADTASTLNVELQGAFKGLARVKATRVTPQPLPGLGVTQLCDTGYQQPATETVPTAGGGTRFLSASAMAKFSSIDAATTKLEKLFSGNDLTGCRFPTELDKLGRSVGEKSFVGVVHIDGNKIGKQFKKIISNAQDKNQFKEEYKTFSGIITEAGTSSLHSALQLLLKPGNVDPGKATCRTFSLEHDEQGACLLPFRPLVFGGDDITFVCDGRIALDLAAACLKTFYSRSEKKQYACAGIALIKSHDPFSRGYELAEQLCRNAKKYLDDNGMQGAAMDWHFLSGGPAGSCEEIRKREFQIEIDSQKYELTCRPYLIGSEDETSVKNWDSFRNKLLIPLQEEDKYKKAHSRIKGLPKILRDGPVMAEPLLNDWKHKGLELPDYTSHITTNGFMGGATPYIDAVELLDFMVPLNISPEGKGGVND